jgi:hypothetical protein
MRDKPVLTVLIVLVATALVGGIAAMFVYGVTWTTGGAFVMIYGIMITVCIAGKDLVEFEHLDPALEELGRSFFEVVPAVILMCEKLPERRFTLEFKQDEEWEQTDWRTGKIIRPRRTKRTLRVYTYSGSYKFVQELKGLFNLPIIRRKPKSGDTSIQYNGLLPGAVDISIMGVSDDPYCEIVHVRTEMSDEEYEEAVKDQLDDIRANPEAHVSVKRRKTRTYIKCVD